MILRPPLISNGCGQTYQVQRIRFVCEWTRFFGPEPVHFLLALKSSRVVRDSCLAKLKAIATERDRCRRQRHNFCFGRISRMLAIDERTLEYCGFVDSIGKAGELPRSLRSI